MYFETIRAKDIQDYANGMRSIIVDLRTPEEYAREHIRDAINIPYEKIEDYLDELQNYNTIILYCDRGNLSLLVARDLGRLGFQNVYSVSGGYRAYRAYR